jgi:hypothetical protein
MLKNAERRTFRIFRNLYKYPLSVNICMSSEVLFFSVMEQFIVPSFIYSLHDFSRDVLIV